MSHQPAAPLLQTQLTCNACSECATCVVVRSLLSDQQALREHLGWAQQSVNQYKAALHESRSQCQELRRSVQNMERDDTMLRRALHETKAQYTTIHQNLIAQRNRHTLTVTSLNVEIHTLWKLFGEVNSFSSNPNHQSAAIKELFHSNHEQQQCIEKLNATVKSYRARINQLESVMEVIDEDGELMSEIEQAEIQEAHPMELQVLPSTE